MFKLIRLWKLSVAISVISLKSKYLKLRIKYNVDMCSMFDISKFPAILGECR